MQDRRYLAYTRSLSDSESEGTWVTTIRQANTTSTNGMSWPMMRSNDIRATVQSRLEPHMFA